MLYFQGTDNKLWRLNTDGSAGVNIGGFKTKSPPVVYGNYVYFQGTDNKFWRANLDGSNGIDLGGYATNSTPCVAGQYVYFQGTDDRLWKVRLDGTGGVNLGGYKSHSSPVATTKFVFFQGTDNKLWRINLDGSGGVNLGGYKTSSPPCATSDFLFFQGTDNKLWRINLDGSHGVHLGGYNTSATPCVAGSNVYFRGTDDKLWRTNLDGGAGINLAGYKTKSTPVVADNFIFFQGTDNKLWRINMDGSGGTHLGGFDTNSPPFVVQAANQPVTGTALPKYQVLTLLYAPPGTNGGKSTSSVDYGAGSTTGTTTSTDSSYKSGVGVSATAGLDVGVAQLGATADFNTSTTTTDSSSIEIKKSTTLDIKCQGPGTDGISHDHDIFYLWLNPQLNVAIDPQDNINWQLGVNGPTMNIQYVYVSWLKNPASMPPGLQQQLTSAGLNATDYAAILALNPFASGAAAIDQNRYAPTTQSFPYIPPLTAADPIPTQTYAQQNSVTDTNKRSTQVQYSVSISVSAAIKVPFTGSLKESASFEWTNTSSNTQTDASTQTASVTVGGPAFGYTGQTDVMVYWDTIFNTFMFAFPTEPAAATGALADQSGKPLAFKPVTLTVGGRKFSTFTDAKGEYRIYRAAPGQGVVTAEGKTFNVPVGPGTAKAALRLN